MPSPQQEKTLLSTRSRCSPGANTPDVLKGKELGHWTFVSEKSVSVPRVSETRDLPKMVWLPSSPARVKEVAESTSKVMEYVERAVEPPAPWWVEAEPDPWSPVDEKLDTCEALGPSCWVMRMPPLG